MKVGDTIKKMTARQFLTNPTGKGSATVARRDRIKKDMRDRYSELYRKARRSFNLIIYESNDNFYFVFRIPSEFYHKERLYYDVVIEFSPPDESSKKRTTIDNYNIRFFSNSPNFLFTYAYIYNKDGMLIPWLLNKVSNKALNEPPEVRNPREEYGFEKSVYFALLYIEQNPRLMNKSAKRFSTSSRRTIVSDIKTSNQKLTEYNNKKKDHDKKAKRKSNRIDQKVIKKVKGNNTQGRPRISKPSSNRASLRGPRKKIKSTRNSRAK